LVKDGISKFSKPAAILSGAQIMKFKSMLGAAIVLWLSALACARTAPLVPPGLAAGESIRTLTHDGFERDYIFYVPSSFDSTQPAALVMVFHGGGGKARNAVRMTDFSALADEKGFLVVYPNGTGPLEEQVLTWNGGTCCGNAMLNNVDDVGFARAILDDLQTIAAIDLKRVYATGMSNGGIMSYRLACEAADVFAAIGSVAGTQNFAPCQPTERVAVIHFHGTNDQHLPYNGGVGAESLVGTDFASVQDSVGFWVAFNGCNSQPVTNELNEIRREVWEGCEGGSSVELVTIVGGGHAWPGSQSPGWVGGDEPTQSISATKLIWEFFVAHPKP
jgi:polyhydroxybutyrate depolymerase